MPLTVSSSNLDIKFNHHTIWEINVSLVSPKSVCLGKGRKQPNTVTATTPHLLQRGKDHHQTDTPPHKDSVHRLEWQQQTIICHLPTGHCCLFQQVCRPVSFREAKTITKWPFHPIPPKSHKDSIHHLEWQQQTILFHLTTGQCCPLKQVCRLWLAQTEDYPCQTGPVPRACSTVLPPLQTSKNVGVAPWSNTTRKAVGLYGGRSEGHSLHPDHRMLTI